LVLEPVDCVLGFEECLTGDTLNHDSFGRPGFRGMFGVQFSFVFFQVGHVLLFVGVSMSISVANEY